MKDPLARILEPEKTDKCVPIHVHFEVTARCRMNCVHCYLPKDARAKSGKEQELSIPEIRDILSQLADLGGLFLTLTGGDVFLRPDIFDILQAAREAHFAVKVLANGPAINAARAKRLAELDLQAVVLSLYAADPVVHDNITRIPGSHAQTLRTFELLKEQGVKVSANCVVMQQNNSDFAALKKRLEDMGVPCRSSATLWPMDNGDRRPVALGMDATTRALFFQQKDGIQENCDMSVHQNRTCSVGSSLIAISPSGRVHPCAMMRFAIGETRQERLASILNSPALARLRGATERDPEICGKCHLVAKCFRCPAMILRGAEGYLPPETAGCTITAMRSCLTQEGVDTMHGVGFTEAAPYATLSK